MRTRRFTVRLRELRARIYDLVCERAHIYMHMHLYPRESAFVYTHKRKRSFLRAYVRVCVRVFARIQLKRRTHLRTKYFKRTLGSETFRMYYTVCAKKNLPCTVRFTLDRLMKTEVKRLLNGLRTDIERTTHGRGTDCARSVLFYVCTYYARVTIKFYACTAHVSVADFKYRLTPAHV